MNQKNDLAVISVSEYVQHINALIAVEPVLVEGEISNCRDIPGRNFRYFDIKDENAVAKCFQGFWNSEKVDLENGMLVRVFGYPTVQRNGSMVIDIREIYLVGKGDLMMNYLKLKKKLESEGLFSRETKKPLPSFPGSIGLIAGKNSSAYHDVVAELVERWPGSEIYFYPSKVQGIHAKQEVKQAIRFFNTKKPVDVLIVARGGGSMEDLQAFDSEEVVREIFASKIPTISAIGHEDHWTLSDFVADMRAKTPTKAAEIAVPDCREVAERLAYFQEQAKQMNKRKIEIALMEVGSAFDKASRSFSGYVQKALNELQVFQRDSKNMILGKIESQREKLESKADALRLLNPALVLERGYAVLEKGGKRIKSIKEVQIGDKFQAVLQDGYFAGTINHKKQANENNRKK